MTPEKYVQCLDAIMEFLGGFRSDAPKPRARKVIAYDEKGEEIYDLMFDPERMATSYNMEDVVEALPRVLKQYKGRMSSAAKE